GSVLVGRMKEGSVLINTARGRVLDLSAIEEGLRSGRLAGVGLDVLPDEPIPENEADMHPLIKAYKDGEEWLRGRMVITPHVAFYSTEAWDDIRTLSCETMRDVLLDGLRRNVVKPEDEYQRLSSRTVRSSKAINSSKEREAMSVRWVLGSCPLHLPANIPETTTRNAAAGSTAQCLLALRMHIRHEN
ncbi:10121_t:CDS:2, partial [Acaulospora colombiana]